MLQNTDISADPADSCAIFMTVHRASSKKLPSLSAHCRFDDHIRCVAAKKNLSHKRESLRLAKMSNICEMLDIPGQPTAGYNRPKGIHYSKLTIVNDKSSPHAPVGGSHAPVGGSHDHMTSMSSTSPLVNEEAMQFASKNDDGSLMLPFKAVEMDQLGSFTVSPRSPDQQQLNMFLESSSFSHEDHHLDQHHDNFDQRQLSIDQQNSVDQVKITSDQRQNNQVKNQTTL